MIFRRPQASFAKVYQQNGDLAPKALEHLQTIYKTLAANSRGDFESFVQQAAEFENRRNQTEPSPEKPAAAQQMPAYAGSDSCRTCHGGIYLNWSHSGMSKMLRPYAPENVIGDFTQNNRILCGGRSGVSGRETQIVRGAEPHAICAHGNQGRQALLRYPSNPTASGTRYPVDYTIGSKWQQAYATKLPNGEIHVFPIQYNAREKQWLNFWKVIDSAGSDRADLQSWQKFEPATSYLAVCAVCHTSQLRNVKGGGFGTENLEFRETGD